MLNTMRSETYRLVRNKPVWITALVLILAEVSIFAMFASADALNNISAGILFEDILSMLGFFSFLPLMLMMFFASGEDKEGTIKHSIAYGISRNKLYLARFFTHAMFCTMVYLIMLAGLVLMSLFLLPSTPNDFVLLFTTAARAWPVLISLAAFAYLFLMNLNNNGTSLLLGLLWTLFLPPILDLLARKFAILYHINPLLPIYLLNNLWTDAWYVAPLAGTLYTLAFLLIGMYWFKKKELK